MDNLWSIDPQELIGLSLTCTVSWQGQPVTLHEVILDTCEYCDNGNHCVVAGRFMLCKHCGRTEAREPRAPRVSISFGVNADNSHEWLPFVVDAVNVTWDLDRRDHRARAAWRFLHDPAALLKLREALTEARGHSLVYGIQLKGYVHRLHRAGNGDPTLTAAELLPGLVWAKGVCDVA